MNKVSQEMTWSTNWSGVTFIFGTSSMLYLPVAEVSTELTATSEPMKVEAKVVHNLTSPSLSEKLRAQVDAVYRCKGKENNQ